MLGGLTQKSYWAVSPALYHLDLRANINHNISTKGWYIQIYKFSEKNNSCDPSFSSSVIKDVRNRKQNIRFTNERK